MNDHRGDRGPPGPAVRHRALVLWEHEDGELDLEEMKEAMAWLGGRAQHALKAGPSEDEVRAAVARAFGE
jgi:hypothetical protein